MRPQILIVVPSPTLRAVCRQSLAQAGLEGIDGPAPELLWEYLQQTLTTSGPFYQGLILDWPTRGEETAELLGRIADDSHWDSLAVLLLAEQADERLYRWANYRANNDIQLKDELSLMPYRMARLVNAPTSGRTSVAAPSQATDPTKGRILFVDDSPTICHRYQALLQDNGYDVHIAHSLREAVAVASQVQPQLAVVDYFMPEGNGDELCRALLADPRTREITVVMHSQRKEVTEQALNAGAIDLIWKDDPINIFVMRVASLMRSLHAQGQAKQLDVLFSATEALGVGVMMEDGDSWRVFNTTMSRFAADCGDLHVFSPELDTPQPRRLRDREGINRAFHIYSVKVPHQGDVVLVQDVTTVADQAEELERARDEAMESTRLKSQFLANMSHEIRTPLTSIIGFTETLLEPVNDTGRYASTVNAVLDNARHLHSLINDILDLSKIEADRLEVERIEMDLQRTFQDCLTILTPLAKAKDLELSLHWVPPLPKTILSDPTRLRQVLINLGGNAIKFTAQGAVRLLVSCDVAAELIMVSVVDNGIGLNDTQLERLFQPFTQADASVTRRYGGTGLGLYIAQKLTQRLGGELRAWSIYGAGSLFVATFATGPIDKDALVWDFTAPTLEQPIQPALTELVPPPRVKGRILLAEDNPYNQTLITHYLAKTGAETVVVGNGEAAVSSAMEGEFQLVLMDMQMPVMGGLEATRLLRDALYPTPIIALTAHSMASHQREAEQAGCDGFLTKPVDWVALYRTVAKYLPAASATDAHSPVSGDNALASLVARFRESLPDTLASLAQALTQDDLPQVASLAHQIKGVAGGLGYPLLGDAARTLERAAQTGDRTATQTALTELRRVAPVDEFIPGTVAA